MSWEIFAGTLHTSSTGQQSFTAGIEQQRFSADPHASEQPYLGTVLLTPTREGPREGGPKIAHSATVPGQVTAAIRLFHYVEEKLKLHPRELLHGA